MVKDYLSVAEFADAVGVSRQAIYKQARNENSQLAPYVLRKGNSVYIASSALVELYGFSNPETTQNNQIKPKQETFETKIKPQETTQTTQDNNPNQPIEGDYIAYLKAQIQGLQEEQKRLNETICEKDKTIKEQSDKIANLAQQITEIAKGAILTTAQQQQLSAGEKGIPEGEKEETPQVIETEIQETVSFWKRLFRKK